MNHKGDKAKPTGGQKESSQLLGIKKNKTKNMLGDFFYYFDSVWKKPLYLHNYNNYITKIKPIQDH